MRVTGSPVSVAVDQPALTPAQHAIDARDWTFARTWPYEPCWHFTDDIRLHYVDEGPPAGEPVVMLHGNPTWSYLYRRFIGPLAAAGFRAVAHDAIGFGRSDKPKRQSEYSLQRHAAHFSSLMDELALDGVTLVLHDWGGPIGLTWAVANPDRVARLVLMNTFTGRAPRDLRMPIPMRLVRAPVSGELLVKGAHTLVRRGLFQLGVARPERLGDAERAAYLAPHPSWESRTGVLSFPRLISIRDRDPTTPLADAVESGLPALATKPSLILWAMRDPAFGDVLLRGWLDRLPDAELVELADAAHFVPEDAHEQVVPVLLDFLRRPVERASTPMAGSA